MSRNFKYSKVAKILEELPTSSPVHIPSKNPATKVVEKCIAVMEENKHLGGKSLTNQVLPEPPTQKGKLSKVPTTNEHFRLINEETDLTIHILDQMTIKDFRARIKRTLNVRELYQEWVIIKVLGRVIQEQLREALKQEKGMHPEASVTFALGSGEYLQLQWRDNDNKLKAITPDPKIDVLNLHKDLVRKREKKERG